MTGPRPTCTRTEQAVGWALHALEPDEEIVVERHVPTCTDCSAAVRDTQAVMTQLATAVEQVDPPARLRASILDAAAATPQIRPRSPTSCLRSPAPAVAARSPSGGSGGSGPERSASDEPAVRRTQQAALPRPPRHGGGGGRGRRRARRSRVPYGPAPAADGPVAAAARHGIDAGVQHHGARAGSRPTGQLTCAAGPPGRHGGCGGRPGGQPANRLHDRPRRQLRRPDLCPVGAEGHLVRPGAARGLRRGRARRQPADRRLRPARSHSAPTPSPWSPAGHLRRFPPTSSLREPSPPEALLDATGPCCTVVRAGAISSGGERFVHTEEVTGSIPVSPTSKRPGQSPI